MNFSETNLPFKGGSILTQGFGKDNTYPPLLANGNYKPMLGHDGLDLVPIDGNFSVYAIEGGTVIYDVDIPGGKRWYWGNYVGIWNKEKNIVQYYAHLNSNNLSQGQEIQKGEYLGEMGSTGIGTGPHLHLGTYMVDSEGMRLNRDNGYFGAVDGTYTILFSPSLLPYQRIVSSYGVNRRDIPNLNSNILETISGGKILDFRGWDYGENVGGNNIWFMGLYSDNWFHSGAFTDSSTNGLSKIGITGFPVEEVPVRVIPQPEITPVPEQEPIQELRDKVNGKDLPVISFVPETIKQLNDVIANVTNNPLSDKDISLGQKLDAFDAIIAKINEMKKEVRIDYNEGNGLLRKTGDYIKYAVTSSGFIRMIGQLLNWFIARGTLALLITYGVISPDAEPLIKNFASQLTGNPEQVWQIFIGAVTLVLSYSIGLIGGKIKGFSINKVWGK